MGNSITVTVTDFSVRRGDVLNGTSAYSPNLDALAASNGKLMSGNGTMLQPMRNGTGLYMTVGNATSHVVTSDVALVNGVMQVLPFATMNVLEIDCDGIVGTLLTTCYLGPMRPRTWRCPMEQSHLALRVCEWRRRRLGPCGWSWGWLSCACRKRGQIPCQIANLKPGDAGAGDRSDEPRLCFTRGSKSWQDNK